MNHAMDWIKKCLTHPTRHMQFNPCISKSKYFVIEIDNKVAGQIVIKAENDVYYHKAEIAYFLGEEYWGRGIMTSAI